MVLNGTCFINFRNSTKSSKKLFEQCTRLDKHWSHLFTSVLPLTSPDTWYNKLRETIDRQANVPIWTAENKVSNAKFILNILMCLPSLTWGIYFTHIRCSKLTVAHLISREHLIRAEQMHHVKVGSDLNGWG